MNIEKTFEAECIDDTIGLTKGKKYVVAQSKEYNRYFILRNDNGEADTYRKERFKIVEAEKMGEVIKVRCTTKNSSTLTFNKEYQLIGEQGDSFKVKDDMGEEYYYPKRIFKKIELQKELNHTPSYAEEQYKKLKEENKNLEIKFEKHLSYIDSLEKENEELKAENEKYREGINDFNKCLEKSEEDNKRLKKEIEELKETRDYLNKVNGILEKEIRDKAKDNAKLRQANAISYDEYKESLEMLEGENNKKYENEIKELKSSLHDVIEQNNNYGYLLENYRGLLKIAQGLAEANKWLVCNRLYVEGLEE